MFIKVFAESDAAAIEPHVRSIGEEYLKLFYKFVWFKFKTPDIDDFGKKIFEDISDADCQIHLVRLFLKMLCQQYADIYDQHRAALVKFVPEEMDEEHQEQLAIIESQFVNPVKEDNKSEDEEEESALSDNLIEKPKIKVNNKDEESEKVSDFLEKFP